MRNYLIDIIKLFLATFVVIGHTYILVIRQSPDQMLSLQNIAVDGFFIISGFFLCKSINKLNIQNINQSFSILKFNIHRYKRLFPEFFITLIFSVLIYRTAFGINLLSLIPINLFYISQINTISGIQNGAWYVSVLFYVGVIYSIILFSNLKEIKYSLTFIITLLSFLFLFSFYGNLSLNQYPLLGNWLSVGWIKGFMDLGIGILTFAISEITDKNRIRWRRTTGLALVFIAISLILYSGIHFGLGRRDFLCLPGYAFLIYFCSIEQTKFELQKFSLTRKWGGGTEVS